MDHITSDLHCHHQGVLRHCPLTRAYGDVEEMNAAIKQEWNSKITQKDTTYHLGDFSFCKDAEEMADYIIALNGKIIFIRGNHDTKTFDRAIQIVDRCGKNVEVHHYLEVKYNHTRVCMFHFPMRSWHGMHKGSACMHGHSHGNLKAPGRILDVGWDANESRILTFKEAFDKVMLKPIWDKEDHHKESCVD